MDLRGNCVGYQYYAVLEHISRMPLITQFQNIGAERKMWITSECRNREMQASSGMERSPKPILAKFKPVSMHIKQ